MENLQNQKRNEELVSIPEKYMLTIREAASYFNIGIENERKTNMVAFKKERKMKVYAQSGYHYKDTATIILKGAWLETLGFEPGTPINVEREGGRLVITRADEVIAK